MSARAIVSGVLAKPPVRRTSKANKPYLTATVRDGEAWVNVLIFAEADIETIKAMIVGEPIAVAGPLEASIWAPEGREPRVNLSVIADAVLSARRKPKPRETKTPERPSAAAPRLFKEGRPLDDDIPF